MATRDYTSRRQAVVNAFVEVLKNIDGSGVYLQNVHENVQSRFQFWDEIKQFPHINVTAGAETREYLPGNFKWRFMNMTIRIYVKTNDDPREQLEQLIEDVETVIESNPTIAYTDNTDTSKSITDIRIDSIDTDEGVLEPFGIAEIVCEVRY